MNKAKTIQSAIYNGSTIRCATMEIDGTAWHSAAPISSDHSDKLNQEMKDFVQLVNQERNL